MSRDVNVRIIAASAPVLGIRNDGGVLKVEVTADPGTSNTIQTTTALNIPWTDWTNLLGNGSMQLLPLNELTNLRPRFFRAYTQ